MEEKEAASKKITEIIEPDCDEQMKELLEQSKKIQFDILMKLYSIVRYIIDNIQQ